MFRILRTIFQTISGVQQAIYTITGVVIMVTASWAVLWVWIKQLDTVQIVLLAIAAFGILVIFVTAFISWWYRRNITKILDILSQIDQMTLDYIDSYEPNLSPEEYNSLLEELGELLDVKFERLKIAITTRSKTLIKEFQRMCDNYTRLLDPSKKVSESLRDLLLMGDVLNEYGVGLANITNTPQYKRLNERVKELQKIAPSAETSIRINDYFNWSKGLYCLVLSTKPITNQPDINRLLPVRARALSGVFRPLVEGNTATLITAVRESIEKPKRSRKE